MIYEITPINNYSGNNSTTQFDFDFYIDKEEQLTVYKFDASGIKTTLVRNQDYTISEVQNENGGYITFPIAGSTYSTLSSNEKISIELTLPISQETQYNNSSLLNLKVLEYSLDYLTRLIQILSRKITRCVKVDECSSTTPEALLSDLNTKSLSAVNSANSALNSLQQITAIQQDINTKTQNFNTSYTTALNNIRQTGFYMSNDKLYYLNSDNEATEFGANRTELDQRFNEKISVNSKVVDGQWVNSTLTLFASGTYSTFGTYDLSNYLPSDDYNYEVIIFASAGGTSLFSCEILTDIITTSMHILQLTTTYGADCNALILPVGTARTIQTVGNGGAGWMNLGLRGYRRIGTNS